MKTKCLASVKCQNKLCLSDDPHCYECATYSQMSMSVTLTMEDVTTLVPTLKAHLNAPVMKVICWTVIILAAKVRNNILYSLECKL